MGLWQWTSGWVRAEAEGGFPERLLNDLTGAGITAWRVQRRQEWTRFSCLAKDYRRIRPFARRAGVRMRVRRKHGIPFWVHRYRHRRGLAVALITYGVILGLLAPRIWVVQVVGNTTTPTETIVAALAEKGVRIGVPMSQVDIKTLQLTGTGDLSTLGFITLNPSGCVARIEVAEREPTPEILDLSQPSEIVALRDGRILWMEVRSGQRLVKNGEAVFAGTPLITGRVVNETEETLQRAYGVVWAETRRQITVTVPLLKVEQKPTERRLYRPTFTLLNWRIPLYSAGTLPENMLCERQEHFLTVRDMTLPLGLTVERYTYTEAQKTALTPTQAATEAEKQLLREEQALFADSVFTELSRSDVLQGGNYILTAIYRCEENIALEVPLVDTPLTPP